MALRVSSSEFVYLPYPADRSVCRVNEVAFTRGALDQRVSSKVSGHFFASKPQSQAGIFITFTIPCSKERSTLPPSAFST